MDYESMTREQLLAIVLRRNRQMGWAMKCWSEAEKKIEKLEDEITGLLRMEEDAKDYREEYPCECVTDDPPERYR